MSRKVPGARTLLAVLHLVLQMEAQGLPLLAPFLQEVELRVPMVSLLILENLTLPTKTSGSNILQPKVIAFLTYLNLVIS